MVLPDIFHRGEYTEARRMAQQRARYFFVYLHSPEHPRCERFLQTIANDTPLQELLADRCYSWAGRVDTSEGFALASDFEVTSLPFIAVGVKTRFLMTIQGSFTPQELVEHMERAMDTGAPDLAKEIAFQAERNERESLRRQQDEALALAMKHDQERAAAKEAARRAQADAERRAQEEAAETARREAEKIAREKAVAERKASEAERALRLQQEAAAALPAEPADDAPSNAVAQVRLVTVSGATHNRRFSGDDPAAALFRFAESVPQGTTEEWELVCGFPPRPLVEADVKSMAFRDVKTLWPRSVVTARRK